MKERPILWSAPMVLALLAGRKTQTRRFVKPQPVWRADWGCAVRSTPGAWLYGLWGETGDRWSVELDADHLRRMCTEEAYGWGARAGCPYGVPGDRLWGRETFCWMHTDHNDVVYRADHPGRDNVKWTPSIFMRRWMSRLQHEVTAVRCERLQEISSEDALAEGIEVMKSFDGTFKGWCWPGGPGHDTPRAAYLAGWDTINGKGSAAKNPWVWVVAFKPVAA